MRRERPPKLARRALDDPLEPSHSSLVQSNSLTMSGTLWSHRSSPSLAQPVSSANALFVACMNTGVPCGSRRGTRVEARALFGTDDPRLQPIEGDIRSRQSVADAIAGARGVVNSVSLYIEHGKETFHAVHVEGAQRVAVEARRLGVEQLVHISGIGADAQSRSPYIRSRGQGELAVRTAYPGAILVRPAVMFGPDDAFLTVILKLLQRLPAYPIFGSGMTKLQPAHVDDVAEAVARIVQRTERDPITLECGGPHVYTYKDLVRSVAREAGLKPRLIPVPFAVWHALARAAEFLPSPAYHAKSGRAHAG